MYSLFCLFCIRKFYFIADNNKSTLHVWALCFGKIGVSIQSFYTRFRYIVNLSRYKKEIHQHNFQLNSDTALHPNRWLFTEHRQDLSAVVAKKSDYVQTAKQVTFRLNIIIVGYL